MHHPKRICSFCLQFLARARPFSVQRARSVCTVSLAGVAPKRRPDARYPLSRACVFGDSGVRAEAQELGTTLVDFWTKNIFRRKNHVLGKFESTRATGIFLFGQTRPEDRANEGFEDRRVYGFKARRGGQEAPKTQVGLSHSSFRCENGAQKGSKGAHGGGGSDGARVFARENAQLNRL